MSLAEGLIANYENEIISLREICPYDMANVTHNNYSTIKITLKKKM